MNGIEFRDAFNIPYDNLRAPDELDAFLHGLDGRGLIIAGYPGVGKSSIAKYGRFIDLESSLFRDAAGVFDPYSYVRTAVVLASQGHTVLTSTHKAVVDILVSLFSDELPHSKEVEEYTSNILGAVIFCPDPAREHQDL